MQMKVFSHLMLKHVCRFDELSPLGLQQPTLCFKVGFMQTGDQAGSGNNETKIDFSGNSASVG
jgi:hypothetical protein